LLGHGDRAAPPAARDDPDLRAALGRAAAQFPLTPAAVDGIVERLETTAPAERSAAVWSAAREAARGGLDTLAQRIDSRATFDDFGLPSAQLPGPPGQTREMRQRGRGCPRLGVWGQ